MLRDLVGSLDLKRRPFPLGDVHRGRQISHHVHHRPAHIQQAIDAEMIAISAGLMPIVTSTATTNGVDPDGHAGRADAAEHREIDDHQLLRRASDPRPRAARETTPSRPHRAPCRSGLRSRRPSARTRRSRAARRDSDSDTRRAVGRVAFDELVENAVSMTVRTRLKNSTGETRAASLSAIGYTTNV